MGEELKLIPCGVNRCESTHKLRDLEPEYEELKKKYDEKIRDMENFSKILEEKEDKDSLSKRDIIIKNVKLNDMHEMSTKEIHKLKTRNEELQLQLEEEKKLKEEKAKEIFEIKTKHEYDEEIISCKNELKNLNYELQTLRMEKTKLEAISDRLMDEIERMEDVYNERVTRYNDYVQERTPARGRYHKESRYMRERSPRRINLAESDRGSKLKEFLMGKRR